MLCGPGLRMRSQEVVEHVEKCQNVLPIVTRLASPDVIDNQVPKIGQPTLHLAWSRHSLESLVRRAPYHWSR